MKAMTTNPVPMYNNGWMESTSLKLELIQLLLICHELIVPITTAGKAMITMSRQSICKMLLISAPLIFRMAISLLRRRTSSLVYPINPMNMMHRMEIQAMTEASRKMRAERKRSWNVALMDWKMISSCG